MNYFDNCLRNNVVVNVLPGITKTGSNPSQSEAVLAFVPAVNCLRSCARERIRRIVATLLQQR